MPAVPPYSSTTIARCARSFRISDRADRTVLVVGSSLTGRPDLADQARAAGRRGRAGHGRARSRSRRRRNPGRRGSASTGALAAIFAASSQRHRGRRGTRPRSGAPAPRGSAVSPRRTPRSRCAARPALRDWCPGDQVAQFLAPSSPRGPRSGSPPSSRTTRLVDFDSSQTSGRASVDIRSSSGAANSDDPLGPLQRQPLGRELPEDQREERDAPTSPPRPRRPTRPRRDMWCLSADISRLARVAAPNAPDSRVARVTPIWTVDRNRLGSCASRAARWPRLPRLASARTWPSRSETSAISAAAKKPPISTMTRTMRMSQPTSFTS